MDRADKELVEQIFSALSEATQEDMKKSFKLLPDSNSSTAVMYPSNPTCSQPAPLPVKHGHDASFRGFGAETERIVWEALGILDGSLIPEDFSDNTEKPPSSLTDRMSLTEEQRVDTKEALLPSKKNTAVSQKKMAEASISSLDALLSTSSQEVTSIQCILTLGEEQADDTVTLPDTHSTNTNDARGAPQLPSIKVDPDSTNALAALALGSPRHGVIFRNEFAPSAMRSSPACGTHLWFRPDLQLPEAGYITPGIQADVIHSYTTYPQSCGAYFGSPDERRMQSPRSVSSIIPQKFCLICGDEASGCHYGVLTCGSCKVFFKRAVEGHHTYLCAGRNDCIVDKIRRKNCPACRLRKCYEAGMMLGGRKIKKFGNLKAINSIQTAPLISPQIWHHGSQDLGKLSCLPSLQEVEQNPQVICILETTEPDVVCAGTDNCQLELPSVLLSCLNQLCERQLLSIVKWTKTLPGFRNLHLDDQMILIQYSWMSIMVFSMGWRSYQNGTHRILYFAPDLILTEEKMKQSPIYDLCLSMLIIPQEFQHLQLTKEEFLCMKVLLLLNTIPLEGLKSQSFFDDMRQCYIKELTKAIHRKTMGIVASSQRFYQLTKLMDSMHKIVKKLHLYCLNTFIQSSSNVTFPEMMSEIIIAQLPKILAGMVKPLYFHKK
ncbi:progesterone receptor isoform X1 [Erpetoichthys calabaricus]|nr:progesterone receptor isoform X1 [Erpetoichthys calabaricus]